MECEYKGCDAPAAIRHSMTCYVDENGHATEAMNPKPVLCEEHWEEYREYWQNMWDEYHSGLGV